MSAVVLSIGGHLLSVEGDSAMQILDKVDAVNPFVTPASECEWTVRYDVDVQPLAHPVVVSRFNYVENDSACTFYNEGKYYQLTIVSPAGELLVRLSYFFCANVVDITSCHDYGAMRFSLWFAYSMLSAFSSTSFVHSSTIIYSNKAVMFLGESGTGKSTQSRMWLDNIEGVRLLNDDSPVITVEGTPVAYGSPWSGKTPCYHNVSFPIAAVVRLSQAPFNAIRRLGIAEAFAALQPSLPPALMQSEPFADKLIDIISCIISVVPVYHLQCLPNADAARLCRDTVFGKNN